MKVAVANTTCVDQTTTASPVAAAQLLVTSSRYDHNTTIHQPVQSTERPFNHSEPRQVLNNSIEFEHASASKETGSCLSTNASSVTQTDVTTAVDGDKFDSVTRDDHDRGSHEETTTAASSTNIPVDRKLSAEPETVEHCCSTNTLTSANHTTEGLEDNTGMTFSTTATESTRNISIHTETSTVHLFYNRTHVEDCISDGYNITTNDNHHNHTYSLCTTVPPNHESATAARQRSDVVSTSTDSVELVARNQTFNFMFDGNCLALKRRGPEVEKSFRSVVVDALSSGLSVSADRLVAGELRCGSLNLTVTLLDASDDDVLWVVSTLAVSTLRISVEDVDETFVLSRVELTPLPNVEAATTEDRSRRIATTNRPGIGRGSVAILVVFVIIGALAVFAGTVSAAIYLYFRRIYCRTFVVNRRALRWSSRAGDTVHVINVDDDDGSSNSRPATNDADEWSPPISGSRFDDDRHPIGFANWSPHYCQARFRRMIAPPPSTLTSLPELLDDEESTVDISSANTFHECRQSSCIINLLQPLSAVSELHVAPTNIDGVAKYQFGIRKPSVDLTGGRPTTFDWTAENFLTSNSKERATPF